MKCKCGREAVYYREHEGTLFCAYCFCKHLEKKVKKTIRLNKMVSHGDKIAIALSGGKDYALLFILNKIFKERKDVELLAIGIDEGIKGYRSAFLKNANKVCKKEDIQFHIYSFKKEFNLTMDKIQKIKKLDPCTCCEVFRKYLLNKAARSLGATKLATGHNLDDEAQGILINYLKGDLKELAHGSSVLANMKNRRFFKYENAEHFQIRKTGSFSKFEKPKVFHKYSKFITIIKPMKEILEREIALYAVLKNLNRRWNCCPYKSCTRLEAENFINDLELKHPGIKYSFVKSFNSILPFIGS